MKVKTILYGLIIACMLALQVTVLGLSQSNIFFIDLFNVDYTNFPTVTVQGRVLYSNKEPVESLSSTNLTLQENNQPVEFESRPFSIGTQIAIVIDGDNYSTYHGATGGSRIKEMQTIASQFVDSLTNDDSAMVLLQQESKTVVLQDSTSDKDKLRRVISDLQLGNLTKFPRGLDAIRSSLDSLKTVTGTKKLPMVVFISPGVFENSPGNDFSDVINYAKQLDIPIHTILVRSRDNDSYFQTAIDGLQNLAQNTGGVFIHYSYPAAVDDLFAWIKKMRLSYTFTFRSKSSSNSERTVELLPKSQVPNLPHGAIKYVVTVDPPKVNIVAPEPGKLINRDANAWDQPSDAIEPSNLTVTAQVNWQQYARAIVFAELLVDNSPAGTPQSNPPGTTFSFPWDLRTYNTQGKNAVSLRVHVKDELGVESESDPISVKVVVTRPPQPIPTGPGILAGVLCSDLSGIEMVSCYVRDYSGVIAMVLAGIALVLVVTFGFRNRGRIVEASGEIVGAMNQAWVRLTQGKKKPVAFLAVLSDFHRNLLGDSVPIFPGVEMTTIGRNLRTNTIHIPDSRDNTPISREHCAIIQHEGKWAIKDYNSTHGTFVEKVKIEPATEFPLHDGDEIWVGTPAYGGARFLFRMAAMDGTMPEASTEDRTTR